MELIKDLGSKTIISKSGKTDTRKWGLFLCPSCSAQIELKMYKGNKNATCGKAGCRKRATTKYRSDKIPEDQHINNLPYNSSFRDFYNRLPNSVWKTLNDFRLDMYESYAQLRKTESRVTLFIKDNKPLHKGNCYWTTLEYEAPTDFSADITLNKKHTLMLAQETGIASHIVTRTLSKMDSTFGETKYEVLACPGRLGRPYRAYFLTDYQYKRLRDRLLDNVRKASSNVYIMRCDKFTKIGIATDVYKRRKALIGANPFPVELLFTVAVPNANKIEEYLHKKYKECNHHHEWFELNDEQVEEIKDYLETHKLMI